MRLWVILFLLVTSALALPELNPLSDELEEPDEDHYTNALLTRLFSKPLNIHTADSSKLHTRGFSKAAARLILQWQQEGAVDRGLKGLRKNMDKADKLILAETLKEERITTQIILRQRLQYSASLAGWRVLHKGRVRSSWGDLVFLAEQDPSESQFTDHSILTFSSGSIPGLEQLIIGDFHMAWGSGMVLNQNGSRLSLSPGSLARMPGLRLTPHYSTRETGYFHGIAARWQLPSLQGIIFVSKRKMLGQLDTLSFREDSDGIHPTGKLFDLHLKQMSGVAGIYEGAKLQVYGAALMGRSDIDNSLMELGLHWQVSQSQYLQVYADISALQVGGSVANWLYKTKLLQLSIQYRYFPFRHLNSMGSVVSLLGTQAPNEQGFSTRVQIRVRKGLLIRYALDTGNSVRLTSLRDTRSVIQHKAQLHLRSSRRAGQLDWSYKNTGPIIPNDVWEESIQSTQITKIAISLNEKITAQLRYRLNLKTASDARSRSLLIQQRILWSGTDWKGAVGFVRYAIPESDLRLSIYESGLVESFNFFTAFKNGQRWFLYLKNSSHKLAELEFRLAQTLVYGLSDPEKQLEFSFQLSIVL